MAARVEGAAGVPCAPAATAARRLLVVVLNFNGLADTLACLDSLRAQDCDGVAVLVVDNGSAAGEAGRIAAAAPWAEVVPVGENRGWAGGNNVGLRLALERDFDNICLLNNDTVLRPDALAELLAGAAAVAQATGTPGLLHPVIHYADPPGQVQLDPGPAPATGEPVARLLAEGHDVVELVGWAYGACLLLPAALVRRVGLLDERFFLQLEEQDYYRRAQALGMRSYCARRARILHRESASFGGRLTPAKIYYMVRNTLLLAEKHDRSPRRAWPGVRKTLWALRHQAAARRPAAASLPGFLRWLCSADPVARAVRQGAGDYLRRRFGPRPASP